MGRFHDALPIATEAVDNYRRLADPQTGKPAAHAAILAKALTNLASALHHTERHDEELAAIKESLASLRSLAAANPDLWGPAYRTAYGGWLRRLASWGHHNTAITLDLQTP
jgi:hypothetical protein